jgi:hypothetical protein
MANVYATPGERSEAILRSKERAGLLRRLRLLAMTGKIRRRDFPIVIASQRVGAKRRPMTGSAKQSTSSRERQGVDGRVKPGHDAVEM